MVRRVTLLWHGPRPIGICVFATAAANLRLRNQFFGLYPGERSRTAVRSGRPRGRSTARSLFLKRLNQQLWLLARVVLHPTYRGAGVAAAFVRRSCTTCPVPWIETLSAMGQVNPFFERAGFLRVGVVRRDPRRTLGRHGWVYGRGRISAETSRKSRFSEPVYYVFDNRQMMENRGGREKRPRPPR